MSAEIISGTAIAKEIREELKYRVLEMRSDGAVPGLATVLVGANPASQLYVGMKNKAAKEIGIHSRQIDLPQDVPEEELLGIVEGLNADPEIHGILVQLPLPDHIDEDRVLLAIDPAKDVDGFHPRNVGALSIGRRDVMTPCTPTGVIEMLMRTGNAPRGKHAVIVGRSNIVGKPMAALLLRKGEDGDATVSIAHSRTPDMGAITRQADILIVAVGIAGLVTADMVKPGAVVIDVGINRVDAPDTERGYRVVGDVDFEGVKEVASAITPVPGGVGPMTIALLLKNTVDSAGRLAPDRNRGAM